MRKVATMSLPAVNRWNADRLNAARSCQLELLFENYDFIYNDCIVTKAKMLDNIEEATAVKFKKKVEIEHLQELNEGTTKVWEIFLDSVLRSSAKPRPRQP